MASVPRRALGAGEATIGPFLKPLLALGMHLTCTTHRLLSALLGIKKLRKGKAEHLAQSPKAKEVAQMVFSPRSGLWHDAQHP